MYGFQTHLRIHYFRTRIGEFQRQPPARKASAVVISPVQTKIATGSFTILAVQADTVNFVLVSYALLAIQFCHGEVLRPFAPHSHFRKPSSVVIKSRLVSGSASEARGLDASTWTKCSTDSGGHAAQELLCGPARG
jgi:hypothetical protein